MPEGPTAAAVALLLNHPTLALQLDIQSGPGLSGALMAISRWTRPLTRWPCRRHPARGSGGRTLDVLAAGAVLHPNRQDLNQADITAVAPGCLIAVRPMSAPRARRRERGCPSPSRAQDRGSVSRPRCANVHRACRTPRRDG